MVRPMMCTYAFARGDDDRVYLDLGDAQWRAVEITRDGWQVITNPPVRFRRPRGLLPLTEPERGESLSDLRPFVNVATDADFLLMASWLLAALRGRGPYPILVFMAEQGSAKTTNTRVLRRLGDPNDADVRRPPRNTEDLMIAATNGHVVAFDHLSRLTEELSDNLSVLATGGGFAVRQLYTNAEEQIFNAMKPIILNGISQVATRGDLLDRAIVITLPPIPEERRKDEATFWADFDRARPRILGALLDAVAIGLRHVGAVRLERKPRMADFAIWGVAVEPACPWPEGTFLWAYAGDRSRGGRGDSRRGPAGGRGRWIAPWEGTASELLQVLSMKVPEAITTRKDWFSKPRQVSDALRRLAPGLRRIGIDVTFERDGSRRTIHIEKVCPDASSSSPASHGPENQGSPHDDRCEALLDSSPLSSQKPPNIFGRADDGDADDEAEHTFRFDPTKAFVTEPKS